MSISDDPIALGVFQYHFYKENIPIKIYSNDFDVDEVMPSYFFRGLTEMPRLEQEALSISYGKVLDVGACAGCHSIILQEKKLEVFALEQSPLCCDVLKDRNIKNVIQQDIQIYERDKFDTILLLMNGTGIAGTLSGLDKLLVKLRQLLNVGGQILIDSSDLVYLYQEEDGSALIDLNADRYYGELTFQTEYKNQKGKVFPWLYVDPDLLALKAEYNGLVMEQVFQGENFDYLARLTLK